MGSDILILTVYGLVVFYVLYQMAISIENELEDRLKIQLDVRTLLQQVKNQLKQQPYEDRIRATIEKPKVKSLAKIGPQLNLLVQRAENPKQRARVTVAVRPVGVMPLGRKLNSLQVIVVNESPDAQIYVDWDRSTITADLFTQRVVRQGPVLGNDLTRPQVFSVVNPGELLTMDITGEGCLSPTADTTQVEISTPIVDMNTVAMGAPPINAMDEEAMAAEPPAYSLNLMLGIRRITESESYTTYLLLPFGFQAFLLPDEIAFPPLRWLLNAPRPAKASDWWETLILGKTSKR